MPNYENCIIYTIKTPTGLYVGSTCNFIKRKHDHKCAIHNKNAHTYNLKLYKNIRENNDEWDMKPYNEFPCKNKTEMNIEEERVRCELNADLNMFSCYNSKQDIIENKKQYYKDNKDKLIENHKQYRENNKEKVVVVAREVVREVNREEVSA